MIRGGRQRGDVTLAQAFNGLRADYNAARDTRFRRKLTGVNLSGSGADYHYRSDRDYLKMLELSRNFDRNDPIVGQGVSRLIANILQDGIQLDPKTGNKEADTYLFEKFGAWCEDADQCHDAGELTFHDIASLAFRHTIVDGDVFLLPLKTGSLQAIEGHRVRTPRNTTRNVVNGILLDEHRRRIEYWITKDDIDPNKSLTNVSEMQRVRARDGDGNRQVLHLYLPRRLTQTRGVTAFAPIVDLVGMHDDIQFAKLVQQQVTSCFAIFRTRAANSPGSYLPLQRGEQTTETLGDGSSRTIEGIAPGMEIVGQPGETLEGFSPNVPNAEFFHHAMLILTFIAINLDLPVAVLLLDPSETNFSGWRGAMDQARTRFRVLQKWLAGALHKPVYLWKIRQWLAEGDERLIDWQTAGVDLFKHRWNRPRWPYIEPTKDVQADLSRMRGGLTSPRRLKAEHGEDWEEIADETVADNAYAIRAAKAAAAQINKEFSDDQPVHWRELIALPIPEGMTVKLAGEEPAEKPKRSNAKPKASK